MINLVRHAQLSYQKAEAEQSKITPEILQLDGMTGKKTRHFYNNLCSGDGIRYLEIGTWKGSSICSAMCGNNMVATVIENWSEFGGPKQEFLDNFENFKGDNDANFIESDCWAVDPSLLGMFNIYMYDGNHDEKSHFKALNHFYPCLDNQFIYLVDDWNWEKVRTGTINSINQNNLKIIWEKEIRLTYDNSTTKSEWWNGLSIFILEKM